MNQCIIDYCAGRDEKILTVISEGQSIVKLGFCGAHAIALRDRLAYGLGVEPRHVNLAGYGGTIGELQEAIDYLDAIAVTTQH